MAGRMNPKPATFLAAALLASTLASGAAVAAAPSADASPPARAQALASQGLAEVPHDALDSVHVKPGVNLASYRSVVVEPVKVAIEDRHNRPDPQKRDIEHAQRYFAEKLTQALSPALPVAAGAGPGTLRIQVTVTEYVPNKPVFPRDDRGHWIHRSIGVGSAAFTAELRDGATGELVAVVSDEDVGLPLNSNLRIHQEWGDADHFVRTWSRQIAALLGARAAG